MRYCKRLGQRLVVIMSCCHAGVIKSIGYAQTLTANKFTAFWVVYLMGGIFDKIILATIVGYKKSNLFDARSCTGGSTIY